MRYTERDLPIEGLNPIAEKEESEETKTLAFGEEALNRLASLQAEILGGRQVPGDSAELIREARAARAIQVGEMDRRD